MAVSRERVEEFFGPLDEVGSLRVGPADMSIQAVTCKCAFGRTPGGLFQMSNFCSGDHDLRYRALEGGILDEG